MPSRWTSNAGQSWPGSALAANSCSYASAAASRSVPYSLSLLGMACMLRSGKFTCSSSASQACQALRSGSVLGTYRSSPQNTWTLVQSRPLATSRRCLSSAMPVPPPVSTIIALPRSARAPVIADASRSPAAVTKASVSAYFSMIVSLIRIAPSRFPRAPCGRSRRGRGGASPRPNNRVSPCVAGVVTLMGVRCGSGSRWPRSAGGSG
ncbi:Uncharacterised protein [Mycobacteroides abscessus subsp. abscessus]|nr:Uncharacterised protein [Mycobacteroides abscessus subsp. abscessus]SIE24385.1 Uncharacterised protein [Mycobacteroides abscessus subsp. abscessus]